MKTHAGIYAKRTYAKNARFFTCGTKTVVRGNRPEDWRVICATCGAGGSIGHWTQSEACKAAVRDSARTCYACGAS